MKAVFGSIKDYKNWILTIGNFDGYHIGHQQLVQKLHQEKKKYNAGSAMISFSPHPKQVLYPDVSHSFLFEDSQKWNFFKQSNVDMGLMIPFTKEFSQLNANEFFEQHLCSALNIKKMIVGHDFCFGKNREGSTKTLQLLAYKKGIEFEVLPPVKINKTIVSSTYIKKLVLEGNFKQASILLNRDWYIEGTVCKAKQQGRKIGFPTANLKPPFSIPLIHGVYATLVEYNDKRYPSVTNVGVAPSFKKNEFYIESFIFNFSKEIYGEKIKVIPKKFLRKEITFASQEKLKLQIEQDIQKAKQILTEY